MSVRKPLPPATGWEVNLVQRRLVPRPAPPIKGSTEIN